LKGGATADILKIASEPYRGCDPESQFTNDLILGTKDFTNVDWIVPPHLEFFKSFLFKYFRCIDYFEAAGFKTYWRRGGSSNRPIGPFQKGSHPRRRRVVFCKVGDVIPLVLRMMKNGVLTNRNLSRL
jgi:hypothetical protein